MAPLSRRSFLSTTAVAGAVAAVVPASAAAAFDTAAADIEAATGGKAVMLYVVDASRNEVAVMTGEGEAVVRDAVLARRIARALRSVK